MEMYIYATMVHLLLGVNANGLAEISSMCGCVRIRESSSCRSAG